MASNKPERLKILEEKYLLLFKGTLLTVLTGALLISLAALVWAGLAYLGSGTRSPEPVRSAPAPQVLPQQFLQARSDKAAPVQAQPTQMAVQEQKTAHVEGPDFGSAAQKVWEHVEQFQKAAKLPVQLERGKFFEKLPQVLKPGAEFGSEDFLSSRDSFLKGLFAAQEALESAKELTVVTPFVDEALEYHERSWRQQKREARSFAQQEKARIQTFALKEQAKSIGRKAVSASSLAFAIKAFLVFLALTLILVFIKIETNLREIRDLAGKGRP